MKHIFIINPAAGKGTSVAEMLPRLHKYMKESGLEYEIHRSLNKNDVISWVGQRACTGDDVRFYAVGGDGTVNDVLCGMVGHPNAELAVIPCGSGNDFVKNFTGKKNFLNIEKQINGRAAAVDLIRFNDSYCINMLNIGADCDIVTESVRLREEKNMKGAASYLTAAFSVLAKRGTYHMEYVDENGESHEEELLLTAIGNGVYCGGGFKACPKASLRDGLMDVCVVRPVEGPKLFKLILKYRSGKHVDSDECAPYLRYMQVKEFDLTPADQFNICIDGEVQPFEKTHFSVIPQGIRVVIPEGSEILVDGEN